MKEIKSVVVMLVAIVVFAFFYNLFLGLVLNHLTVYQFENIFFILRYTHQSNPDDMLYIPQFLNWIFVVSFVFFTVLLFIRIYINKEMKIKNRFKQQ